MKKQLLLTAGSLVLLFSACKKDTKKNDEANLKIKYSTLTSTSHYFNTFKDDAGATTVNFDGQTTRIKMLSELDAYMKKGTTSTLDVTKMENMFRNTNAPFTNAALNSATDKTIISKTAQSFSTANAELERQRFLSYFAKLKAASEHYTQVATSGTAGLLESKYLVNEKGIEYNQLVQKGLIGAMLLDQISNIYLGTEKMAADNEALIAGKNYTALAHNWDEAYGYLTANEYYPKPDPADATKWLEVFLGSYARQVGPSVGGDPSAIYMALLKGRAAIVNKDLTTRNAQITAVRSSLEKAIATIAISYLNKTKTATSNGAKMHSLAEGVGFVYSLRFAFNAKVNATKSQELMDALMNKPNGFWDLTNADIDAVRDQIATLTGVDKAAVVNH
ncbi:DUF4856 domain-containing protein [Taibaiella sp. KBW10]|uniref:DUF4856 domain-containing protein n=1 Tax=Taibaiella sp. KBW10 TaxID=2153357 RepID=UPI000F59D412|nr:DUF4856 domain-containing protein [Taibaiella sp. KBW10]RQO31453.1 DUF4856 domain-containing protein [Taibaiella sp. KBW10]